MTAVAPALPLAEVKAAARALLDGAYRESGAWTPPAGQPVLLVLGCAGGVGATTVALALASTFPTCRLIECAPAVRSGLVAAGLAELGEQPHGWIAADRGGVRLERRAPDAGEPHLLAAPLPEDDPRPVVIDFGHDLDRLRRTGWVKQLLTAAPVVAVTRGTLPGLRHLEATLANLDSRTRVAAAVLGPPRPRWPKELIHSLGPLTRDLDRDGALHVIAEDRTLAVHGLDEHPLPPTLLTAARTLVRDLPVSDAAQPDPTERNPLP